MVTGVKMEQEEVEMTTQGKNIDAYCLDAWGEA